MSIYGSSPITQGLVFTYDFNNIKSYKGPPIQNKLTTLSVGGTGTSTHYNSYAESEQHYIPGVGDRTVLINRIQNNYTPSGNCCPSLFNYGTGIPVSGSTLYTYGILYKTTSGYTHPNFMYRYEYNSSGTYLTEGGFHDTGKRTHLGDGWYWAWNTFTSQPTAATFNCSLFYYNYSTAFDKVYVAKVLLAPGDYSGLHPKYWPEVNTTRASTQSFVDIGGSNVTITPNSITYNSNGTITMGSGYLQADQSKSTSCTFVCWTKTTNSVASNMLFNAGPSGTGPDLYFSGGGVYWNIWDGSGNPIGSTPVSANDGNYHQYVVVNNAVDNTVKFYYDNTLNGTGVYRSASANTTMTIGGAGGGGYPWNGTIDQFQIYNRALTATEVSQLFNSQRSRFGR